MEEFVQIVSSFPTVVYTALVLLSLVFWLVVIAGGMGIDIFEFDLELDAAAEETGHSFASFLSALGLGTVPFSITFTAFAFWGWTLSYVTTFSLRRALEPSPLLGVGVLIAATAVALPLTGVVTYPFQRLFDSGRNRSETVLGSVCEITTSRVDDEFGRGSVFHEGADLVLSVRCAEDNELGRGDEALIIDFDEQRDAYLVEPYEDLLERADSDEEKLAAVIEEEIPADEDVGAVEEHLESARARHETSEEPSG